MSLVRKVRLTVSGAATCKIEKKVKMKYLKTDYTIDSYKLLMTENNHNSTQQTNGLTDLMDSQQSVMSLLSYSTAFSLCLAFFSKVMPSSV